MQVKHLGVMRERNFAAADSGSDCSSTPLSHGARAAAAAADVAQRRLRLVSSLFELFLPNSDSHSHSKYKGGTHTVYRLRNLTSIARPLPCRQAVGNSNQQGPTLPPRPHLANPEQRDRSRSHISFAPSC